MSELEGRKLNFALVLDSTSEVDPEYSSLIRIERVPLFITLGSETRAEPDWTVKEIVDRYDREPCHTSCPSPAMFEEKYRLLLDEGYEGVVCVPMSKGVSGTYQAALTARDSLGEASSKVFVVDACLANYGISNLLNASIEKLKEEGVTAEEYARELETIASDTTEIWTLGDLSHLYKGGRLSKFSFAIGSLLHIKPIISVTPKVGSLRVEKKLRTFADVDNYLVQKVKNLFERFKKLYVRFINLGDENQVARLKDRVLSLFPSISYTAVSEVGPLFTAHLGRNGYGLCASGVGPISDAPKENTRSGWSIFHTFKR